MDTKFHVRDGEEIYNPDEVRNLERHSEDEHKSKLVKLLRDFETRQWLKEKQKAGAI